MAIFTSEQSATETEHQRPRRRRPNATRFGWILIAVAMLGVVAIALVPSPYVIEKPGPVYDTLGTVQVDDESVPLIEIPSETTYPTDGTLDMLTVTVSGTRDQPVSWLDTAVAWLTPSQAVVPIDEVYPEGYTVEQSNEQGAIDMQNSQREAVAAALTDLGYDFSSTLTVEAVQEGSPADGVIEPGDVVTSVNGQEFSDVSALRSIINENGTDAAATVELTRDGDPLDVSVTPVLSAAPNAVPILGVSLSSEYDFPFDVTIQLENVGGPSAGQMFALGIIDKLTPGSLAGGADVAGTGTITGAGEIGPIGGIRQKMYGAKDAGAEYFLAPVVNCDEVSGHIPSGLTVFAVQTLDDSIAALTALADESDISGLPSCPRG